MGRLYKEYVIEQLDPEGNIESVGYRRDPNFNFGYDIVDRIARRTLTSWPWSGATKMERKGSSPSEK